jgi:hypothetical protein
VWAEIRIDLQSVTFFLQQQPDLQITPISASWTLFTTAEIEQYIGNTLDIILTVLHASLERLNLFQPALYPSI